MFHKGYFHAPNSSSISCSFYSGLQNSCLIVSILSTRFLSSSSYIKLASLVDTHAILLFTIQKGHLPLLSMY